MLVFAFDITHAQSTTGGFSVTSSTEVIYAPRVPDPDPNSIIPQLIVVDVNGKIVGPLIGVSPSPWLVGKREGPNDINYQPLSIFTKYGIITTNYAKDRLTEKRFQIGLARRCFLKPLTVPAHRGPRADPMPILELAMT